MENEGDHEGEIHPGSSSSLSSPPSSHSSSSSSLSSPSHPQSFASSRSSQKELSARSSSHSSSSSSSPFSGPSSPAHAPVDQASSSASEESHTTALPSFSVEGCKTDECVASSSNKQDPLDTFEVIEELESKNGEENNGNSEPTSPRLEPPSLSRNAGSDSDACDIVLEEFTLESYNGQTTFTMNIPQTTKATQALALCNGSMSTPEVIQHDLHAASSNSSDSGCKQSLHQAPSEVDGRTGSKRQQDTNLKDESRQTDPISLRNSATAETNLDLTGLHDDVCASRDHDRPSAVCNVDQLSQASNTSIYRLEPEASHIPSTMDLRETSAETAMLPSNMSSTGLVEDKPTHDIKTMNKSSKGLQDGSPDISKLSRAKTMPSGSLEVVNGEVRPSRPLTFKRSSTDKSKPGGPPRASGTQISKKKQKRLVRKMCTLQKDGTVELDLARSARFAPGMFEPEDLEDYYATAEGEEDTKAIHPLQIAMLIVGTRGDVQPFVAIGKRLQEHGHRVRLATHSNFQDFVLKAGLEFYPLGGDPKVLAGYMVKNKGFLPSGPSEIRTQKKQLKSIINSLLPACTQPHGPGFPFKAQAIIANPPAYGHVHVAEALKVPLHIFFTMPWTPTSEFPHPLSRVGHFAANRLSYQVVDSLIWVGIRGIINKFRKKKLGLRPVTYLGGSHQSVSKLPTGYIWSPHLVPKPKDWGPKIDVVGFCFLNLSQDYKPPNELVKWLAAGPAPIYIGFGSLPVEDPSGMTQIILNALNETCQRGIIDKGWGGIGTMVDLPESVYLLDNCPHDWLFSQCAAVVHHGGAGTTAAGLRASCPTTIVPFFGDQAFWGDRVHARGVGPSPIPVDQFSLDKLVNAIRFMLDNEVKQSAVSLAEAMREEDGVEGAVKAFHRHLPQEMPQAPAPLPLKKHHGVSFTFCIPSCFRKSI